MFQPHFDYAWSAWYPNLNANLKKRLQTIQNKFIRFSLQLDSRIDIGIKESGKINWLPVSERFDQYLCSNAFKFFDKACLFYIHDMYYSSSQVQVNARSSVLKLRYSSRKTCSGQKALSYLTTTA